jgi:PST family polysaccharide transporter
LTLKTIVKNAGWLGLIQVVNYAIPVLTLPIVTRAFGPNMYGIFATLSAYATYVGVFASYGFYVAGPRAIVISRERERERGLILSKTVSAFITAQFLLGIVATLIFLAILPFIPFGKEYELVGLILVVQALATAIAPQWIFIGLEQTRDFALIQLVFRVLAAALILFAIRTPDDLHLYVSINCIAAASILILSLLALSRYGIHWQAPGVKELFSATRQASRLFLSTVSISLYTTTTVVIIAFVLGPAAAGAFALADRVRVLAGSIIDPLKDAVYPFVCRIADRGETHEEGWTKRIFFRAVVVLSGLISLALFTFAPFIIWLVGGKLFEDAIPVLRIVAFLPLIIALSNTFGKQTMLPLRMDREYTWVVTSAALLGVTGVFVLTYQLGLPGAALAMVAVETYVAVAFATIVQCRISILSLFFKHP